MPFIVATINMEGHGVVSTTILELVCMLLVRIIYAICGMFYGHKKQTKNEHSPSPDLCNQKDDRQFNVFMWPYHDYRYTPILGLITFSTFFSLSLLILLA